ncbi:MAG: histidine triad nucleotide-binding protein [Chloroflexi bacterium]|nr:histidine triad nucleotide-binding protein [Chloroflexota bacterium]
MSECIFCKIAAGRLPARILYQDDLVTAFHDLHPAAPVHILVIPNRHIASVNDLDPGDEALVGRMFTAARRLAQEMGLHENGYRLIVNTGPHGGQTVLHLHLHLIGGQPMKYPMG